ncbi:MAG: peptide chain release factor 2 [bacterium]
MLPASAGFFEATLSQNKQRCLEIEDQLANGNLWSSDSGLAKKLGQELAGLRKQQEEWEQAVKGRVSLEQTLSLTGQDQEIGKEWDKQLGELDKALGALELKLFLNNQYDRLPAILSFHAGAGGTEAQDWAEMLLRMYLRFCEQKGWPVDVVDRTIGQEAGIKSATIIVREPYAYGYLQGEHGTHRLVRLSPFNADHARHTSFALVEVVPEIEEMEEVEIKPEDLRVDTFMASGHGGQSVNTTYSAVRVVHIPTGITVQCQNERSQSQNKETAIRILKSKLHQKYLGELQTEKKELRGEFKSAEWGNQIRSYVLHPYKLVKDHRTDKESSEPEKMLEGELDEWLEDYLRWKFGEKSK